MLSFSGINGMMNFQTIAAENKWRILSVQQFDATPNPGDVQATNQLQLIKGTGKSHLILVMHKLPTSYNSSKAQVSHNQPW